MAHKVQKVEDSQGWGKKTLFAGAACKLSREIQLNSFRGWAFTLDGLFGNAASASFESSMFL